MSDIESKILNRVRKMMRLAADAGATDGERDNAMRMVHSTLAKYNLDMAQVEATTGKVEEARERHHKDYLGKPWAIRISHSLARLYFCHYFYSVLGGNAGPTQKARHTFVGRTSNVVTAQEMAQFIVESVNKEAQRYRRSSGAGYAEYRAFAQAAAERIRHRVEHLINESKTKGVEATPGTSLVLASLYPCEEDSNKNWLVSQGVKLAKGRSESVAFGRDARTAGDSFGKSVSLHRQIKE